MERMDAWVGQNLKRVREERNLSYTQLSELTGVSKSMLRQIEVGDSSPTIKTLWKIANGLEIPFTALINPATPHFAKRSFTANPPLIGRTEGYRLYPLITFEATRNFEVYYVEVDPDVSLDADPHSGNAEETVLVIQGRLEVAVEGEVSIVHPNELLRFDAGHPHRYRNPGQEMTRAFMIISYAL